MKVTDNFSTAIEGFTVETREAAAAEKYATIDAATGKLVVADAPDDGAIMNAKIEKTRMLGGVLNTPVRNYGYARKMYDLRVESMA